MDSDGADLLRGEYSWRWAQAGHVGIQDLSVLHALVPGSPTRIYLLLPLSFIPVKMKDQCLTLPQVLLYFCRIWISFRVRYPPLYS